MDAQRPAAAAPSEPSEPSELSEEAEVFVDTVSAALRVTGMHCRSCVVNIQDSVGRLPGVSSVEVCLETEKASVCYDPRTVTVPRLRQVIEALPPGTFTAQLWFPEGPVSGTATSQAAPPRVGQPPGATVDVRIEGMFEYDPLLTGPEQLREAVEDMGFDAFLTGEETRGLGSAGQMRTREANSLLLFF